MVFFAGQITSPQSGELAIVAKQFVEVACDDHIQIDVEFSSGNVDVKESYLSPPSLPALF